MILAAAIRRRRVSEWFSRNRRALILTMIVIIVVALYGARHAIKMADAQSAWRNSEAFRRYETLALENVKQVYNLRPITQEETEAYVARQREMDRIKAQWPGKSFRILD